MERLQKLIAESGVCSRRKAEEYIVQGLVKVNGNIITELGSKANYTDKIEVNNKVIKLEKKVYFLLNKPKHTITTSSDTHDRLTVIDLFKNEKERVFAVGRLDYDTTGVLLVTNDGDLSNKLIHPRYEISKVYIATCSSIIPENNLNILTKGIILEDGPVKAKSAKVISYLDNKTVVELEINVGKKHIVKRMIQYIGSEVIDLHRKSIAFLTDKNLPIGAYRTLTEEEIKKLKEL